MINIRTATPDDLGALLRLSRAFYDESGFGTSDASLQENLTRLMASEHAYVRVVDGAAGVVAFAVTTSVLSLESGVCAELQDLFVDPAQRRGGVARALVADAADWARSVSATALDVCIAPNGQDVGYLFTFYAALGFGDHDRRIVTLPI